MNETQTFAGACCEACAWWVELPAQNDAFDDRQGLCHRFPPQVVVLHVLTLTGEKEVPGTTYPQMRVNDWCAEFVVKKVPM